ncbi:hypothetical protein B9Z65_7846 [Elsinoe australis]|uniref:Uncharacterized protein n=1 Tax=Elsinoe australis TaxID=40998 RepID=A0A2P8A0P9_9PEZI|nr:hypothetical protein B9Z65_7846 [Elsinoe australis]
MSEASVGVNEWTPAKVRLWLQVRPGAWRKELTQPEPEQVDQPADEPTATDDLPVPTPEPEHVDQPADDHPAPPDDLPPPDTLPVPLDPDEEGCDRGRTTAFGAIERGRTRGRHHLSPLLLSTATQQPPSQAALPAMLSGLQYVSQMAQRLAGVDDSQESWEEGQRSGGDGVVEKANNERRHLVVVRGREDVEGKANNE